MLGMDGYRVRKKEGIMRHCEMVMCAYTFWNYKISAQLKLKFHKYKIIDMGMSEELKELIEKLPPDLQKQILLRRTST